MNTIEPAGAPVTMISVGSGTCIFLEENQLQADRQANVASTKTLNRYSLGLATQASAYHAGPPAAAFLAGTLCLRNGTDSKTASAESTGHDAVECIRDEYILIDFIGTFFPPQGPIFVWMTSR